MKRRASKALEEAIGVKVVQLDYYTGEFICEYPTIESVCVDYDIPRVTVNRAFSKGAGYPFIAKIPKHKLMLIRKDSFIHMLRSVDVKSYLM